MDHEDVDSALKQLNGEDWYRDFVQEPDSAPLLSVPVPAPPSSFPAPTAPMSSSASSLPFSIAAPPSIVAAPPTSVLVPPSSSLTLNDTELERFVDEQRNENTKCKTKSDLRKWYHWCELVGEARSIGDSLPAELDRLLGHFYCKVRKEDGELLEPGSPTSIQRSLNRHLRKELHKPFSIIRDTKFSSSNEKLLGRC